MKNYERSNAGNRDVRLVELLPWISKAATHASRWLLMSLLSALMLPAQTAAPSILATPPDKKTQQQWLDSMAHLPMSFEANLGQTDPRAAFVSRGSGYTLFLTHDEAVFTLASPSKKAESVALRMHFSGTNHNTAMTGQEELPGKSSYFVGNDPAAWRSGIPTYAKVVNHDLYPGVDLVYYGNQHQLEYDLCVAAGADPSQIAFNFHLDRAAGDSRTADVRVNANGDLVNSARGREVLLRRPVVYQMLATNTGAAEKKLIETQYVVKKGGQVGFEIGAYDHSQPLIIDPVVPFYSTFLGGFDNDFGYGVAMDQKGNAYVTGSTASLNFPVGPCFQCANFGGLADAFVTEFNAAGLVYSTYLGGKGDDYGYGIAVDSKGDAFVTGSTNSANFPVSNCFQCVFNGGLADAFVIEVVPGGAGFLYSTYLGGKSADYGRAIAVDAAGDAFVTGNTNSMTFPVVACTFGCALAGGSDAFVTEVRTFSGVPVTLVYSDFLGGARNDYGYGIAVDTAGSAFVVGATQSVNFPTTPAACFQCVAQGMWDAFVTHAAPFGAGLVNSTYLGGPNNDYGYAIAINPNLQVYVTGQTASPFPIGPCFQCAFGGGTSDAFVTKLNTALTAIIYSTYLGGKGVDAGRGIAVDFNTDADVTGNTSSLNFPLANCFQCAYQGGASDAFVTSLRPSGVALNYSTYLGGKAHDYGRGIAVNPSFSPTAAWVTGYTDSSNFPAIGLSLPYGGLYDAFVTGMP